MKNKALFIANLELKETEGIYKKVCAQAEAIKSLVGNCDLITKKRGKAVIKSFSKNSIEVQNQKFFDYLKKQILSENVKIIYIRHMIPNFKLIHILRIAKNKDIKIYYEIPTYPYFGEQLRTSRKKYRAVAKIGLDIVFWPIIYFYIDKLVVIRSNSKSHHFKKMLEITNGVKTSNIVSKDYNQGKNKKKLSMVTVGTLYPYHGYDRILKGLKLCNEKVNDIDIEFHIVGDSPTITELKHFSSELQLKNVFFHGIKTTDELNVMYNDFDIGLGCLALHRRNADIDTTLKVVEYFCRGIPVISSGVCPIDNPKYYHIVSDNELPVDIIDIYNYYKSLSLETLKNISNTAVNQFDWDNIMKEIITNMECEEHL